MNKERILALADIIEKQPHTRLADASGFNMINWTHPCGTPCCIGGFCDVMIRQSEGLSENEYIPLYKASAFLGLSSDDDDDLRFIDLTHPSTDIAGAWEKITPARAAAVLRNLAATGEVDWSVSAPVEA